MSHMIDGYVEKEDGYWFNEYRFWFKCREPGYKIRFWTEGGYTDHCTVRLSYFGRLTKPGDHGLQWHSVDYNCSKPRIVRVSVKPLDVGLFKSRDWTIDDDNWPDGVEHEVVEDIDPRTWI